MMNGIWMAASWVGVGVLSVGMGVAGAQTAKRPMTFADLMAMRRVSDPQVSPGGKWVMFSVTDVSLEKNSKTNHLWVVGLEGKMPERQVTFGDGEANGRFSPDGKTVSLTMKGQIYEMPWDEAKGTLGEAVQVTNVNGGADGAVWSPDSKKLMFVVSVYPECSVKGGGGPTSRDETARDGAPRFAGMEGAEWAEEDDCDKAKAAAADADPVKAQVWTKLLYRHWNAFTGERRSHVAVGDADTGRHLRDLTPASAVGDAETPTFSLGGPLGYAWAPDSKEIAYVTNLDAVPAASTNNDVFTLRLDGATSEGPAKAVKVSTSLGSDDGPQYSPDGRWLASMQARAGYESDRFRLMVFDREKKTTREWMSYFDAWVDEFAWTPNGDGLLFTTSRAGSEDVDGISLDDNRMEFLKGEGEFSDIRPLVGLTGQKPAQALVAVRMTARQPSEVFVYPTRGADSKAGAVQLTHLNDDLLAELDLARMEPFTFEGAKKAKVEGLWCGRRTLIRRRSTR